MTKKCLMCNEVKDLSEFQVNAIARVGRRGLCQECFECYNNSQEE